MRAGRLLAEAREHRSRLRLADLDAVTVDAHGTLLRLHDPVGHLSRALRERGVDRARELVERGFRAESAHYRREKLAARDEARLARLRVSCARVFLDTVGAPLDAEEFAPAFDLRYEPVPGAVEALARLARHGLALAVVANWDVGLHRLLERHGLRHRFAAVVISAEVGAAKPDPVPFRAALERLGVAAGRALHVGDEDADREGALAGGLHFRPAPLAEALDA